MYVAIDNITGKYLTESESFSDCCHKAAELKELHPNRKVIIAELEDTDEYYDDIWDYCDATESDIW